MAEPTAPPPEPDQQADPLEQYPGFAIAPAQGAPSAAAQIGNKPEPIPPDVRRSYAGAAHAGETLGPQDYQESHLKAGHPPVKNLDQHLPDFSDIIDAALGLAQQNSLPPTPDLLTQTRHNLLDHWAETGKPLPAIISEAKQNPDLADRLTRAPPPPPRNVELGSLIQHLEGSADNAVSSAGAVGRNQIMPATARDYGFDPKQLKDPVYNQKVADAIEDDLMRRYHGDTQAVLVAYNAGPAIADIWLQSNRDMKVLPAETQAYLRRASQLGAGAPEGGTFDPLGMIAGTGPGFSLPNIAQLLGMPSFEQQVEEHDTKLAEMEKEGVPLDERMTYDATHNPFANIFGVGNIGSFTGNMLGRMFRTAEEQAQHELSGEGRQFAQATIREQRGGAERATQVASAALEKYRKGVNQHLPEYEQWLRSGRGKAGGPKPVIQQLIDHVEGLPGPVIAPNSEFAALATELRAIYQKVRSDIEREIPDMASFVEDYYRHMWTKATDADRVFGTGRQGSSASLKQRTIPTLSEGIAQGLTPRILDPIDNTLHYVTGMRNFLAQHRVFKLGQDNGYIKFSSDGLAPEPGWQPLKGRFATIAGGGILQRAYAPAGFASSYNSWVGTGFYQWPKAGETYAKLQFASNMMTGLKLSLSGYHAWNIAQEAAVAGLANGIGELSHGELIRGMKDIGFSATILPKLSESYIKGRRLQQQYMMLKDYGPDMEKLADLFTRSGGRAVGRGQEYMIGDAPNWFKAWRRGSLKTELKNGAARTIGNRGIFQAAPQLPPVPQGSIRFYHGGQPYTGGSRWLTEDTKYATGYASKSAGGIVQYVDIPETELVKNGISKQFDDTGTGTRAPYVHFDAPPDIAKKLRPVPTSKGTWAGGEAIAYRAALFLPRVGTYFAHEAGRMVNTVMAPLFDDLIPKVKMASWADEMATWLRHNPLASEEAQLHQARILSNSMDDRFGEMVQDNLFWPRVLKQSLNLATVSVGWEYGTLRAFGGAAKDILKGNVLSPRARWLMAFPIIMGIGSAAYQYFKTGSSPTSSPTPLRDLLAGQTGGQTPEGAPERGLLPGYEKDPLQWFNVLSNAPDAFGAAQGIGALALNKLNPMGQIVRGVITGKDWAGNDIRSRIVDPYTGEVPPGWEDYLHFTVKELGPIQFEQPWLRGTNISQPERSLGIRPAPEFIQNPERVETLRAKHEKAMQREERVRLRHHNARLEEEPEQ